MVQTKEYTPLTVIEASGRRLTIGQWAKLKGMTPERIIRRLESGWPEDDAVLTPPFTQRNQK